MTDSQMKIGVPVEIHEGETRVATTPDVVKKLVKKGFTVAIEKGAGVKASFTDQDYVDAGAEITDAEGALTCPIVFKVRRPTLDELGVMKDRSMLISLIELCEDDGTLGVIFEKEMQVFALEKIPRISRAQSMDALSSQSNISGYRAVIEGATRFGRFVPMMMTSAGSAKPARVVVLGVGVAGLQAIATARRLGAEVYAYDIRPETREQILSLGAKPIDLDVGESGSGEGGYAKELSEESKAREQALLADELKKAHIIITTALIPCRKAPVLVTPEVVSEMRKGSVIIDMAAATGGNCPLTVADEVIQEHGVTIVGYTNFPAMMPADASLFYAKNIANLLDLIVVESEGTLSFADFNEDEITRETLVTPETSICII